MNVRPAEWKTCLLVQSKPHDWAIYFPAHFDSPSFACLIPELKRSQLATGDFFFFLFFIKLLLYSPCWHQTSWCHQVPFFLKKRLINFIKLWLQHILPLVQWVVFLTREMKMCVSSLWSCLSLLWVSLTVSFFCWMSNKTDVDLDLCPFGSSLMNHWPLFTHSRSAFRHWSSPGGLTRS